LLLQRFRVFRAALRNDFEIVRIELGAELDGRLFLRAEVGELRLGRAVLEDRAPI
jgi:hypothetical protein